MRAVHDAGCGCASRCQQILPSSARTRRKVLDRRDKVCCIAIESKRILLVRPMNAASLKPRDP